MKVNIEITDAMIRELIYKYIADKLGPTANVKIKDIKIGGELRVVYEGEV